MYIVNSTKFFHVREAYAAAEKASYLEKRPVVIRREDGISTVFFRKVDLSHV
jgi:hypothetical protein